MRSPSPGPRMPAARRRPGPVGQLATVAVWAFAVGMPGCEGREGPAGAPPRPDASVSAARIPSAEAPAVRTSGAEASPCCEAGAATEAEPTLAELTEEVRIPDVELLDQDGRERRFVSDLLAGRPFAINFVFTTCQGVCPVLGAGFSALGRKLEEGGASDVALISVSVDPLIDTPARLKEWGQRFGADPRWTLVTGSKREVDRLLKALRVFAADKNAHSQSVLVGDGSSLRAVDGGFSARLLRVPGTAEADRLLAALGRISRRDEAAEVPTGDTPRPPAEEYFTKWVSDESGRPATHYRDLVLTDQEGRRLRFYADLLRGRCVVVHTFFGACDGVCPKMLATMSRLRDHLGPRLGRDVHLLSISVNPEADTPDRLKALAEQLGAGPGWHFLTGDPAEIVALARKLQPNFSGKDSHSTCLFIGNLRTDTWAKPDLASHPADRIIEAAERIWGDEPGPTGD